MKKNINAVRRKIMRSLAGRVGTSVMSDDLELSDLDIRRVLIIRPNSRLGNQLLITPLLQEVEKYFPEAKIDLFVRGNLAPILLKNYKSIDRVIKLPSKPFKELAKYLQTWISLRDYKYDLVINVDGASSSGRLSTRIVKSKYKLYGDELSDREDLHPDHVHMAKRSVYNLRYYLRLSDIEINQPIEPLSLRLNAEELANGAEVLKSIVNNDKPTICIYTFATGSKCYSKEWWQGIYNALKIGYGEDYNILEVLPKENVSQIDFDAVTYYSMDIREMGAVMANSIAYISADCGIMHLASSVGIPTAGLFSVTNIEIYRPYNEGSIVIDTSVNSVSEINIQVDHFLKDIIQTRL